MLLCNLNNTRQLVQFSYVIVHKIGATAMRWLMLVLSFLHFLPFTYECRHNNQMQRLSYRAI